MRILNINNNEIKTTDLYDCYWLFAAERQDIFYKRIKNKEGPWSDDVILREYKFTNAYRASDRTSQFLIRNIIYNSKSYSAEDVFFRTILFKLFNKIETWAILSKYLSDISSRKYSFSEYDRLFIDIQNSGSKIYSSAYIMPSGKSCFGSSRKHRNHLRLIEMMLNDDLPGKIKNSNSMEECYQLLLSYPSIGPFLAYQFTIDINYSELTNFSENDFVIAGPGAVDGISKCFNGVGKMDYVSIIKYMVDNQEEEFDRLGVDFKSLWGRPLHLIDCQNLFCEISKYSRISHPAIKGLSGRTKIKQKFKFNKEQISYFYPPKWNLSLSETAL